MSVTIEFVGICTHIREVDGVPHRVVLIDAREPRTVKGKVIPSHDSSLRIDGGTAQPLGGVRLAIEGGRPGVAYASDWHERIPKLVPRDKTPFVLSPGVRDLGDPSLVAAWIDIRSGRFEVVCQGKATGALLTIEAASPRLITRPLGSAGTETFVDLAEDSRIVIQNMAVSHTHEDDSDHFLLHYLIADGALPDYAAGNARECRGGIGLPSLGPGCSNSDFP